MTPMFKSQRPVPFYLEGSAGDLSALYFPPAETPEDKGDVIFVHPFADEWFFSRDVAAAQARKLAEIGVGVLLFDLYGCGDSAGEFRQARWEIWKKDVAVAIQWLRDRGPRRVSLWGLRLGGLLAVEFATESEESFDKVLLWQPLLSGEQLMTQFLRLRIAFDAMRGTSPKRETTADLRRALVSGTLIEAAGYDLAPELAIAIDSRNLAPRGNNMPARIHWVELLPAAGSSVPPDTLRVIQAWKDAGTRISLHQIVAKPFWVFKRGSVAEYRELLAVTEQIFGGQA